jgi:hypothetical protein
MLFGMSIDSARKRGRPKLDAVPVNVRLLPADIEALDAHRGETNRAAAVREIVREKLLPKP